MSDSAKCENELQNSDITDEKFEETVITISDSEEENENATNCECGSSCNYYNEQLQTRILLLRETIRALKSQLNEEREIWQREIAERRENEYITRATQYGLEYYKDVESDLNVYQNQILQAHFEKRQLLEKQIAMSNYKRRLLEVENMCNLELLRVKQSVQILQPLQAMCSEWKFSEESGDFIRNEELKDKTSIVEENDANNCWEDKESENVNSNNLCEVEMPLEVLAQKVEKRIEIGALNSSEESLGKTSKSQPSLINYIRA